MKKGVEKTKGMKGEAATGEEAVASQTRERKERQGME